VNGGERAEKGFLILAVRFSGEQRGAPDGECVLRGATRFVRLRVFAEQVGVAGSAAVGEKFLERLTCVGEFFRQPLFIFFESCDIAPQAVRQRAHLLLGGEFVVNDFDQRRRVRRVRRPFAERRRQRARGAFKISSDRLLRVDRRRQRVALPVFFLKARRAAQDFARCFRAYALGDAQFLLDFDEITLRRVDLLAHIIRCKCVAPDILHTALELGPLLFYIHINLIKKRLLRLEPRPEFRRAVLCERVLPKRLQDAFEVAAAERDLLFRRFDFDLQFVDLLLIFGDNGIGAPDGRADALFFGQRRIDERRSARDQERAGDVSDPRNRRDNLNEQQN